MYPYVLILLNFQEDAFGIIGGLTDALSVLFIYLVGLPGA